MSYMFISYIPKTGTLEHLHFDKTINAIGIEMQHMHPVYFEEYIRYITAVITHAHLKCTKYIHLCDEICVCFHFKFGN